MSVCTNQVAKHACSRYKHHEEPCEEHNKDQFAKLICFVQLLCLRGRNVTFQFWLSLLLRHKTILIQWWPTYFIDDTIV